MLHDCDGRPLTLFLVQAMAASKGEKELQVALMQGVVYGHVKVVEEAGKALNKHYVKMSRPPEGGDKKQKTTGPQMLDFLVMRSFKVLGPDTAG